MLSRLEKFSPMLTQIEVMCYTTLHHDEKRRNDMILNFQFSNWACYRDEVELSMQAGGERERNHVLSRVGAISRPVKILPVAAIYGNNASGKSQFVQAISFLKEFICDECGKDSLLVVPFVLDRKTVDRPTLFALQFVANEMIFEYRLEIHAMGVLFESLAVFNNRMNGKVELFRRERNKVKVFEGWGDEKFRAYATNVDLRPTKSFLSLSYELAASTSKIKQAYEWFSECLQVIFPESHYSASEHFYAPSKMTERVRDYLERFDIGIDGFSFKNSDLSMFPSDIRRKIDKNLKVGECARIRSPGDDLYLVCRDKKGRVSVRSMMSVHKTLGGKRIPFLLQMESDGTKRMLDLIPAFSQLCGLRDNHVYVVDELDRSLHHLVTREFLEDFLAERSGHSRTQLIFTTHDLLLMTQSLLRRDEMWLTEKSPDGIAQLSDVGSFQGIRNDKSILNLYLGKRMGGVPRGVR